MISVIESSNFKEEVLESSSIVLVDFYAEWCGPCKVFLPILEEISDENPDVKFVKINVDENPSLASTYDIKNIPTILVFDNGKLVARNVGSTTKLEITKLICPKK